MDATAPPAAAWQQAVIATAATMDAAPYTPRLQDAIDLVLADAVVTSGTHRYAIDDETGCPCADAQHRSKWCKHRVALELYRRARARLQPEPSPNGHAAPQTEEIPTVADTPQPTPQTVPVTHIEAFAESTLCVKVRVGNAEFSWTLRGTDEDVAKRVQRQLAFLDRLATERGAGEGEEQARTSRPKPCPEHGAVKLKASTKVVGQWYCAGKTGETWCQYKTQAA